MVIKKSTFPHSRPKPGFLPPQESLSGVYAPIASIEERVVQLESAVEQQERRITGILKIAATLRQHRDPRGAMKAIVVQISQLLHAERTTIYELSEDQNTLEGIAVQDESSVDISVNIEGGRGGIAGLVATTKRSINLKDAYEHPKFDIRFDKLTGYRTRSVLCVPMLNTQDDVIGVVQVLNKHIGIFSVEDRNLLSALASQAAITLEALRLECALKDSNDVLRQTSKQLERKVEEQGVLFEIEHGISMTDQIEPLAHLLLPQFSSVIQCDLVGLFVLEFEEYGPAYFYTQDESHLQCTQFMPTQSPQLWTFPRLSIGEGLLGKVASRGQEFALFGDRFEKEALPRHLSPKCTYVIRNAIAVPLIEGPKQIGALVFINCKILDKAEAQYVRRTHSQVSPVPQKELNVNEHSLSSISFEINEQSLSEKSFDELNEKSFDELSRDDLVLIDESSQSDSAKSRYFSSLIGRQLGRAIHQVLSRRSAIEQERMMTIGQMLSGVLHDLRGPLTSINGYTQLMAKSEDLDKRNWMSQTIKRKVSDMNEMMQDIMSFARGDSTILVRKVYLQTFVDSILDSIQSEFDEHHIEFKVIQNVKEVVYFDERKMVRVITNIARNARQAMQEQGQFIWTIYKEDHPQHGSVLIFKLADSGPGIPESIRERVFDVFMTSGKAEGTGLGLAIVKQIVEAHQGWIRLETQTGVGTTFTLYLPQSADTP
jgi:signal transduction histidine kinase